MQDRTAISTDDLKIGYDSDLIEGICIKVMPGRIVTLIGPNGCGKSTLLKTLTGNLKSRGGVIYLDGKDRETLTRRDVARSVSYVMTRSPAPELMTCREVIENGRYPYTGLTGRLSEEDEKAVAESMDLCECADIEDMLFTNISDGQRQRVMLARALAQEPDVLVLDEPTSYLDIKYRTEILSGIRRLCKSKGIAVLMSVHEPETAMRLSDTVVAMGEGAVLRIGTPQEVFTEDFIRRLYRLGDADVGQFSGMPWFPGERGAGAAETESPAAGAGVSFNIINSRKGAHHLAVMGTMSGVGKSIITGGLCRILAQDGIAVAPFKSQNMANNSYITSDGLEMGRAQVMQALCAKTEPVISMNPVLLKPYGDKGSQVIVRGRSVGNMNAKEYFEYRKELVPVIGDSIRSLERSYDVIIVEGAGSPAEINLKENDIVNMGLAKMLGSPVLLVGDIDRGGVFAQLIGTLDLLPPDERSLVKGLIVNKFRGDRTLFEDGVRMLSERANCPVTGVIPYTDIRIDDEDSLSEVFDAHMRRNVDIAVIRLPHISNFTDLDVFAQTDEVSVRFVGDASELRDPDVIVIPGTKNTIEDMKWMNRKHLSEAVCAFAAKSGIVIGICGGFQMLGMSISDPEGMEGGGSIPGLGVLNVDTVMENDKTQRLFDGRIENATGILADLKGCAVRGYEIHMGRTVAHEGVLPFTSGGTGFCSGNIYGTYVHGLFDLKDIAVTLLEAAARRNGTDIDLSGFKDHRDHREEQYDRLADVIRASVDMKAVYEMIGI